MLNENDISAQIIGLSNILRRCALKEPSTEKGEHPTGMQHWVLGYLHHNIEKDLFQKDLEAAFEVRSSTISGMLQLLEKNGYIRREPVDYDARLRKLILTQKAITFCDESFKQMQETEALLIKGFNREEEAELVRLLKKVRRNLERADKNKQE